MKGGELLEELIERGWMRGELKQAFQSDRNLIKYPLIRWVRSENIERVGVRRDGYVVQRTYKFINVHML